MKIKRLIFLSIILVNYYYIFFEQGYCFKPSKFQNNIEFQKYIEQEDKLISSLNILMEKAISDMTQYVKKKKIETNILYGGIEVTPNLQKNSNLYRLLTNYMENLNIFNMFRNKKIDSSFIILKEIIGNKAYSADLESVSDYNNFFLKCLALNPEDYQIPDEKHLSLSDIKNNYSKKYLMYGYILYSKKNEEIFQGTFHFVLKLISLDIYDYFQTIYPRVEHISFFSKTVDINNDKERIDRETNELMQMIDWPLEDINILIKDLSFPWGVVPDTHITDEKWMTLLLLDLTQKKIIETKKIKIVDTTLIRTHLFNIKNNDVNLYYENIKETLPKVLILSALKYLPIASNYYCRNIYLLKCSYNKYKNIFWLQALIEKNISWQNEPLNNNKLTKSIDDFAASIHKSIIDNGRPIKHIIITNDNMWSPIYEEDIVNCLKYQIAKQFLNKKNVNILFQTDNSDLSGVFKDYLSIKIKYDYISIGSSKWEKNIELSDELALAYNLKYTCYADDHKEEEYTPILRKTEMKKQTPIIVIKNRDFIKQLLSDNINLEIKNNLTNISRQKTDNQLEKTLKLIDDFKSRIKILKKRYGSIIDKNIIKIAEQKLKEYEDNINLNNKIIELIRNGDISTIFTGEENWETDANAYYKKAISVAQKGNLEIYTDLLKKRQENLIMINYWTQFQEIFKLAEKYSKAGDSKKAKQKYQEAAKIGVKIKKDKRIAFSKRFIKSLKEAELNISVQQ